MSPSILQGLEAPTLRHLDLSMCRALRRSALAGAVRAMTNLRSLQLAVCDRCSPSAVMALLPSLPGLRYINLSATGGWGSYVRSASSGTRPAVPNKRPVGLRIETRVPLPWGSQVPSPFPPQHSLAALLISTWLLDVRELQLHLICTLCCCSTWQGW